MDDSTTSGVHSVLSHGAVDQRPRWRGKTIILQLVLQLLQEGVDAIHIRYSPSLEVFKGLLDVVLRDVVSGE